MLRIQGSPQKLCDGLHRRDFLHVGGLGAFGLGLSDFLRLREAQAAKESNSERTDGFGAAKSCILLFPYGSPPQHETFDPKPDAPREIQGEMGSIPTVVPGLHVGDEIPRVARVMDRVTVVRSVTHPYPLHGVAYALSGIPTYTPAIEALPRDARHWPFIGSIVDYLDEQRTGTVAPKLPRNIALPWPIASKTNIVPLAGPYAAFLGQAYDPVWTDFVGDGTTLAPRVNLKQKELFYDPHDGVKRDGKFELSPAAMPLPGVSPRRFGLRRSLLSQFDRARVKLDAEQDRAFDRFRTQAVSLLTSSTIRDALDVAREPDSLRERYGMTLFGQGCIAARRLVESGCRFVTLFWDTYGEFFNGAWDTHQYHYPRLRKSLLPGFDLAYSALIEDLDARGLLDETLVLWLSEHGRTPKINSKPGGGRDHWSKVYSVAFAGGGTARGKVVGKSDRIGGEPVETPFSPKDLLATTFHLLGIDPDTHITTMDGRPVPIAGTEGRVRDEVIA